MAAWSPAESVDWLPAYTRSLRALLHDPNANYFSNTDLFGYINEARRQLCTDAGTLRQIVQATLPAGQNSITFGGAYSLTGATAPSGGVAPFSLVSGANAAATASTASVPLTVTISTGGTYFQPPLVSFDAGSPDLNLSATAVAVLGTMTPAGAPVASVQVLADSGLMNQAGVTPAVQFTALGTPVLLAGTAGKTLTLAGSGAGQSGGCVVLDAAGTVTPLTSGAQLGLFPANVAAVPRVAFNYGATLNALRPYAYSDLQNGLLALTTLQSMPVGFAKLANSIVIAPVPAQSYTYSFDCVLYPPDLVDFTTIGPIADPQQVAAVKYFAAYLARASQGEEEDAQLFLQLYNAFSFRAANPPVVQLSQPYRDNENFD